MLKFKSSTGNGALTELVELVSFLFSTIETWKAAKADGGGVNILDLPKAFALITEGTLAYEGIQLIPSAWKEASETDKLEVYEYFAERFDLENDVLEEKVEKGILAAGLILEIAL